jgi:hypothetical protein
VSFDFEVRKRGCGTMMRTSEKHFSIVFIEEFGYVSHPCRAHGFALIVKHWELLGGGGVGTQANLARTGR